MLVWLVTVRRRLMLSSLIALVGLMLLSGIASAAEKVVITHWQHSSPAREKMVLQLADEFMKANPGVEIQFQSFPLNDFLNKVLVALAGGAGPDTIQVRSTWVPGLVRSGLLQPLNGSVVTTEQIEKDFVPAAISTLKVNGKYYALPTDAQTIVLFYQPALFENAGLNSEKPPTTWDELVTAAKRIQKRNSENKTEIMGVATGGYGPAIFSLMRQAGALLWDVKNNLPAFNTPEATKGFQFATDLVTEFGVEDRSFGSRWTAFRNEKLGMVYAHPAMKGSFLSTHPNLKFHITEVPAPVPGGSQSTLITTWALGVTKQAKSDWATKWLMYLESESNQQRWLAETGELPTRWSVIKRPEYQKDPDLKNILWSMPNSVTVPWVADDHLTLIEAAYRSVTGLETSVQNALQVAQDKAVIAERAAQQKTF